MNKYQNIKKFKQYWIHKEQPVVIDDEFAKKFKCDTVDKLKEQISKNIEASYDEPIHTMMKMKLFDKLENMLKFDVPASLLARETEILKKQTAQMEQDDPSEKGKSEKEKDDYFSNLAKRRVKIALMLAEYSSNPGRRYTSSYHYSSTQLSWSRTASDWILSKRS